MHVEPLAEGVGLKVFSRTVTSLLSHHGGSLRSLKSVSQSVLCDILCLDVTVYLFNASDWRYSNPSGSIYFPPLSNTVSDTFSLP